MRQSEQVKARLKVWLLQGKSITGIQALKKWKTIRLSSYIHRLRKDMRIKTEMVTVGHKTFAKYSRL